MKKVTSFTDLVAGEGDRIAYTYSEIRTHTFIALLARA